MVNGHRKYVKERKDKMKTSNEIKFLLDALARSKSLYLKLALFLLKRGSLQVLKY